MDKQAWYYENIAPSSLINEPITILTKSQAADLLAHPIEELETSFITLLHLELLHHIFQRNTPSEFILLTPNICAELFTMEQVQEHRLYINKRLIGSIVPNQGLRIQAMDSLWRQTFLKLCKLIDKHEGFVYLIFFYDGQPNLIYRLDSEDKGEWLFSNHSPAYSRLKKLYATLAKVRQS